MKIKFLIVSVLGDVYPEDLESKSATEALVDDFVATALLAEECTARIIELNLSCPNSVNFVAGEVKPPLCLDAALTERVVSAVRSALKSDTRLIAKLSYLPLDDLRELLTRIGPQVDAIAGINTLQSEVHRKDGTETFPGRPLAGVSGIAVRNYALEFVRNLSLIRLEDNHRFEIIGMGGVTDPSSMEAIYRAGANVVQSASGVFANPFLAQDCVSELGLSLPLAPPLPSAGDELTESLRRTLMQKLAADGPMRRSSLAVAVSVPLGQALSAIDDLASEGLIRQQDSQLVSAETSRAS